MKTDMTKHINDLLQNYEEMGSPFHDEDYIKFMKALAKEALKRASIAREIIDNT